MNTDLQAARSKPSFDQEELVHFLNGSEEVTRKRREFAALVEKDPVFSNRDRPFLSRPQYYARAMQKVKRLIELKRELKLNELDWRLLRAATNESLPVLLHDNLFIPTLKGQMSDEQLAHWLHLAEDYKILGCYAQTELGHGSNLRKLETTATFDPKDDTFVLNSPTLSSLKWWPGALGKTSTHAAVFARLLLPDGKDYGMHCFLVRIRKEGSHEEAEGCEVGDIGPKLGFNSIDNGFLRLSNVKIPRSQMMQRYARVSRDGKYTQPLHNKLGYATMVSVRADIVENSSRELAKVVTIATRYSYVRRQGDITQSATAKASVSVPTEHLVIHYQKQQHTLFTALATSYALHFTGIYMRQMYDRNLQAVRERGDTRMMQDVHGMSSGLKATVSSMVVDMMERVRQACGGHGYSQLSGLPWILHVYAQNPTVEGENTILHLQTSRIVLRTFANALAASKANQGRQEYPPHLLYFAHIDQHTNNKCTVRSVEDWLQPHQQLVALYHRDICILHKLVKAQQANPRVDLRDTHMLDLIQLSSAHCMTVVVQTFHWGLDAIKTQHPNLYPILKKLCDLFSLYVIEGAAADLLETGYLNSEALGMLRTKLKALLPSLLPDAVPLVDAFEFSDLALNSAIGRYDGKVYQDLYEWAKEGMKLEEGAVKEAGYVNFVRTILGASKL